MTTNNFTTLLVHAVILATALASSHGILKWVSEQPGDSFFELVITHWPMILLSLSVYGFVFCYYIFVLQGSPVSILYPVYTGLSLLFVSIIGKTFFSESLGMTQIAGTAFILIGIILLSLNSQA